MKRQHLVPAERVERSTMVIRGTKVIVDEDLAVFYGVTTKRLNEQVKRNPGRFPPDFVFQLTEGESRVLRSQIATIKTGRGRHRKYNPYAFTEHGALMAASVLSSRKAIEMRVFVVLFEAIREIMAPPAKPARRIGFGNGGS